MPRSSHSIPGDREDPAADLPTSPSPGDSYIGRIEEWVVSTLDGRQGPTVVADWVSTLENFTLENFTLAKRTAGVADSPSAVPAAAGGWARFRFSRRAGIAVVSLADQAIVKDEDLHELTGDLLALIEAGYLRIVLDFSAVERLSSRAAAAIGEVVRAGFAAEGGAVKFSGLRPELAAIFAMTGLDPRVASYPDTTSAVGGLWPDDPEFRPLPVSILAALMRAEEARTTPPSLLRSLADAYSRSDSTGWADGEHASMYPTRLIFQDGALMGRSFAIRGAKFVIGRGSDCQLRLGSATVSRSHAIIESRGGRLFLRDLASTNGTFLNGRPLRESVAEIRDGDLIRIGKVAFALAVGAAVEPLGVPEIQGRRSYRLDGEAETRLRDLPGATEESSLIDGSGEEANLKFEVIEDTLVVTPLVSELGDEASIDAFREGLLALCERPLPKRVVVNLAPIGYLGSGAIGVLVSHHLRLDRSGGALRLCHANPRVAVVLDQVKIGMLVDYHATIEDAVIAAWPSSATSSGRV